MQKAPETVSGMSCQNDRPEPGAPFTGKWLGSLPSTIVPCGGTATVVMIVARDHPGITVPGVERLAGPARSSVAPRSRSAAEVAVTGRSSPSRTVTGKPARLRAIQAATVRRACAR